MLGASLQFSSTPHASAAPPVQVPSKRESIEDAVKNFVKQKSIGSLRMNGTTAFSHYKEVAEATSLMLTEKYRSLGVAIAYAHDLKEDYPEHWADFKILMEKFHDQGGDLVLKGVEIVTHDKTGKETYKSYLERLFSQRDRGDSVILSMICQVVKLADRLSNTCPEEQIDESKAEKSFIKMLETIDPASRKGQRALYKYYQDKEVLFLGKDYNGDELHWYEEGRLTFDPKQFARASSTWFELKKTVNGEDNRRFFIRAFERNLLEDPSAASVIDVEQTRRALYELAVKSFQILIASDQKGVDSLILEQALRLPLQEATYEGKMRVLPQVIFSMLACRLGKLPSWISFTAPPSLDQMLSLLIPDSCKGIDTKRLVSKEVGEEFLKPVDCVGQSDAPSLEGVRLLNSMFGDQYGSCAVADFKGHFQRAEIDLSRISPFGADAEELQHIANTAALSIRQPGESNEKHLLRRLSQASQTEPSGELIASLAAHAVREYLRLKQYSVIGEAVDFGEFSLWHQKYSMEFEPQQALFLTYWHTGLFFLSSNQENQSCSVLNGNGGLKTLNEFNQYEGLELVHQHKKKILANQACDEILPHLEDFGLYSLPAETNRQGHGIFHHRKLWEFVWSYYELCLKNLCADSQDRLLALNILRRDCFNRDRSKTIVKYLAYHPITSHLIRETAFRVYRLDRYKQVKFPRNRPMEKKDLRAVLEPVQ